MADQETQFREWVETYQAILVRIVRSFAPGQADRDDLLQEILLRLWMSVPKFDGRSEESTWIYRVAFNTALTWKRDGRRKNRNLTLLGPEEMQDTARPENDPADRESVVEQLYGAIHSLPVVDAALVMLALDDLSYKQIARILGITESSVGVRLSRAKEKLARLMKGQDDEF